MTSRWIDERGWPTEELNNATRLLTEQADTLHTQWLIQDYGPVVVKYNRVGIEVFDPLGTTTLWADELTNWPTILLLRQMRYRDHEHSLEGE